MPFELVRPEAPYQILPSVGEKQIPTILAGVTASSCVALVVTETAVVLVGVRQSKALPFASGPTIVTGHGAEDDAPCVTVAVPATVNDPEPWTVIAVSVLPEGSARTVENGTLALDACVTVTDPETGWVACQNVPVTGKLPDAWTANAVSPVPSESVKNVGHGKLLDAPCVTGDVPEVVKDPLP